MHPSGAIAQADQRARADVGAKLVARRQEDCRRACFATADGTCAGSMRAHGATGVITAAISAKHLREIPGVVAARRRGRLRTRRAARQRVDVAAARALNTLGRDAYTRSLRFRLPPAPVPRISWRQTHAFGVLKPDQLADSRNDGFRHDDLFHHRLGRAATASADSTPIVHSLPGHSLPRRDSRRCCAHLIAGAREFRYGQRLKPWRSPGLEPPRPSRRSAARAAGRRR